MFGEEEPDSPSEATIAMNVKWSEQFRRAYPLKRCDQNKEPERKRLNFDDSFGVPPPSTSALGFNARLNEAKIEATVVQRKLTDAKEEIARYEGDMRAKDVEIDSLKKALAQAKQDIILERNKTYLAQNSGKSTANADDWRCAATKYYNWFAWASSQFHTMRQFMLEKGVLDRASIEAINSCCNIADLVELEDEAAEELCEGSVQDYPLLLTEEEESAFPSASLQSTAFDEEVDDLMMSGTEGGRTPTSVRNRPPSPIPPSMNSSECDVTFNQTLQAPDNSYLNRSSFDLEKDTTIERLRLENTNLSDQLILARHRADKSVLLQENNKSLQFELSFMRQQIESTFAELEAMRSANLKKLFDFNTENAIADRARQFVDKVKELQIENLRLTNEVAKLKTDNENMQGHLNYMKQDAVDLEETLSEEKRDKIQLERESEELKHEVEALKQRIVTLEQNVAELTAASTASSSETKSVDVSSTDAGDSTQIFHLQGNPLQVARAAYAEEQSRKRKLDCDEELTAKRARDEEVQELHAQLMKSDSERNNALRAQEDITNMAKLYREMTTALTGFQIKLTDADAGMCQVNSVYDETEKQFVFQYHKDNGRLDLLDVGCDANSQNIPWTDEMCRYIGERQSVPAFLSAVTLQLESQREIDTLERTHTFSVLHED